MARRKTPTRREENLDDFAGPDAEKDAIDRLAKSAAEANKKAGKNVGEAADETVGMHVNLIKAAKVEWRELRDKASQAQGVLRNRYKVAKGDGVDVDSLKLAFRISERASGEVVAEQRNVGRYLRIMGSPLGTQWSLFDSEEAAETIDPAAQGEQAGLNAEPKENNPHTPGTTPWFTWNNGHQVGAEKLAENLRTGNVGGGEGAAAH